MHLLRRFHTEAEVWPVAIVGINGLLDQYAQLGKGSTLVDKELLLDVSVALFGTDKSSIGQRK